MPVKAIFNRLRAAAGRFAGANQGNIAVIFGFAAVPIIAFVGGAVDYSRLNDARASMQSALDSAALMAAKDLSDGTINTSQVAATAQKYFVALYTSKDATVDLSKFQVSYTPKDSSGASNIVITSSGSIETDFIRVIPGGQFRIPRVQHDLNVGVGPQSRMRVAMVLDNTGSMAQNGKMPAMQTAART
jgi:Flp pilus assembly protein TadG